MARRISETKLVVVKGLVIQDGVEFWRLDDMGEGLLGLEAMQKPKALVRGTNEEAVAVAKALSDEETP